MNFLERLIPPKIRLRFKTVVATGVSLFLALRFNDFLRHVIQQFLPDTEGVIVEGILLVTLAVGLIYGVAWVEKALDGK